MAHGDPLLRGEAASKLSCHVLLVVIVRWPPRFLELFVQCDLSVVFQHAFNDANHSPLTLPRFSVILSLMRDIFFSFASASAGVSFFALGGERS